MCIRDSDEVDPERDRPVELRMRLGFRVLLSPRHGAEAHLGDHQRRALERAVPHASRSFGIERTDSTPAIPASDAITPSSTGLSMSTSVYAISPLDLLIMVWMLSPAFAIVDEIWPSMLGTFAFAMPTRYGASRGMSTLGKLTAFSIVPSSR